MATVLKAPPKKKSFGQIIGEGLGSGFTQGFGEGYKQYQKGEEAKAKELTRQRGKLRASAKTGLGMYDEYKSFSPEMKGQLESLMGDYIEQGLSADEAFTQAYQQMIGAQDQAGPQEGQDQSSLWSQQLGAKGSPLEQLTKGLTDYPEAFTRQIAQMGRKGVGAAEGLYNALTGGKNTSPIQGLAPSGRETIEREPQGTPATDFYDKLVGEKGIPRNAKEDIGSSVLFGVPGMAGRSASLALKEMGAPEWVQELGDIGIMFLTQGGISAFQKAAPTLQKLSTLAKESGVAAEEIVKAAGVDISKLAQGEEAALNALKNKLSPAPEVSKKVTKTPKTVYDKQAAIREREVFGERLPESPLEYYEEIRAKDLKKESAKRPETKAREAEVRERLAPDEKRLYEEWKGQKEKLKDIQRGKNKASSKSEIDRIGVLEERQLAKLDRVSDQLKDIQYEMKYGRTRATEEHVNSLIEKQVKAIEDYVANPTEEITAKLKKDLADEEVFLDRANKIMERGELPGEVRPDTFIKMKTKYQDGYKAAVKKNNELIKELKGSKTKADIDKLAELKKQNKIFENRIKNLENRIIVQKDNIRAMRALDKPSGAFYKQQLKSTRQDLQQFQRDFFKQKRIKSPTEMKVSKQMSKETAKYEKAKPEIEKGKKLIEEPTKENIREAAKEADMPESEFSGALKEMREGTKPAAEAIEKGNVSPKTIKDFIQVLKKYRKYSIPAGLGLGIFTSLFEEATGYRIKSQDARLAFNVLGGTLSYGASSASYAFVNYLFESAQAKKLASLKGNFKERNKYLKNMEEKRGKTKTNKIIKKAREM
jgi:hypothetical protein